MTPAIQALITACGWSSSQFLIISGNVFSPLLYYSYFGSVIPSIIIALFVFFKSPKKLANRLLLLMVLSFTMWVFGALVTWATEFPSYTMFFWALMILFEPLVYFFAFYFVYVLIFEKDFSTVQKILFSSPLLITFIFASTRFGLLGYDISNCDRAALEGIVATYGYIIEVGYTFLILGFAFYFINRTKDFVERRKAILLTTGIIAFLLSFSVGNILEVFTDNWYIGQYGLFGAPIFVGFLAYIMVKYKTFNIKIIGTQALVVTLWIALFSILFIGNINIVGIIVICATLVILLIVGILLVRSVLREIEQKEKIEKIEKEVERAYEVEKRAKEETEKAYEVEKKANTELEKLDKYKSDFLRQSQHDLRRPLTIVVGYSDLLLGGSYGKLPKAAKDIIEKMQGVTRDKVKDISNFLDTEQFKLGKGVVSLESGVEIFPMIEEITNALRSQAESKGIYLKLGKPEKKFLVSADREKLKSAIYNMVDNAVKYTEKGGVDIEIKNTGNTVKIIISDTGIGIPQEKLENIFTEQFERTKKAEKTAVGSGVGLYLAGQIIRLHNGKVWAESAGEGKGSSFHIELPLFQ